MHHQPLFLMQVLCPQWRLQPQQRQWAEQAIQAKILRRVSAALAAAQRWRLLA
jgi:hypothetical protein